MTNRIDRLAERRLVTRRPDPGDRRGVLVTFDQAKLFVSVVSDKRMYDYHWPPGQMAPKPILKGMKMLGVDTSNWNG